MSLLLEDLKVPAFCPICKGLMKGRSTITYYDFGCCVDCWVYFVDGREAKWKSGWRPTQEEVDRMLSFMRD